MEGFKVRNGHPSSSPSSSYHLHHQHHHQHHHQQDIQYVNGILQISCAHPHPHHYHHDQLHHYQGCCCCNSNAVIVVVVYVVIAVQLHLHQGCRGPGRGERAPLSQISGVKRPLGHTNRFNTNTNVYINTRSVQSTPIII